MTDEAVLSRIKKLLSLATSDNQYEAANAAARAQQELIKYNVSEEELEGFSDHKNEVVVEVRTNGKNGHNRIVWQDILANTVARNNLCSILNTSYGTGYIWIGKPTNIEVAQYIFDMLVNDLSRICDCTWFYVNEEQLNLPKWLRVHGKTWKNSFYHGANQTIRERLNSNLVQLKQAENNINALMVRNDIEIEEYTKMKYPKLGWTHHSLNRNRSGFEAGKEAGRTIQFREGLSSGGAAQPRKLTSGK